jgi:hypothetical protein
MAKGQGPAAHTESRDQRQQLYADILQTHDDEQRKDEARRHVCEERAHVRLEFDCPAEHPADATADQCVGHNGE